MKVNLTLATAFLFAALGVTRAETPLPSFDCAKARTPDERAVCADARLSELDRLNSAAYLVAKRRDPRDALRRARSGVQARSKCGNDKVCILDSLRDESFIPETDLPNWVSSYRKQLVREASTTDQSEKSLAKLGKSGGLRIDEKGPGYTLLTLRALDTPRAVATGRMGTADAIEYCERDPGGETVKRGGKLSVSQCIAETIGESQLLTVRGDCQAEKVSLGDNEWLALQGEDFETSGVTAGLDAVFGLLCPNASARMRAEKQKSEEVGTKIE